MKIIKTTDSAVLAHCCRWKNGHAFALHNLSDQERSVGLELKENQSEHLIEYFADRQYEPFTPETKKVTLGPFGYRWFRKSSLFI